MTETGVNYNIVSKFDSLWCDASAHDPENGKTSGIDQHEFDGMSLFLNAVLNDSNENVETKSWASKMLADLKAMANSKTNKEYLKSEYDKNAGNVISYDTMLIYNGSGIDGIKAKDLAKKPKNFWGY